MGVTWLSVPFADKDAVKQIGGARWNPDRRSWYLPDGVNPEPFAAWMCRSERPLPTPAFAASQRPKATLIIDMVPKTAWCSNLRSLLSPSEWKAAQGACFRRAGWACEVCGGKGPQWPVECHERWNFEDGRVQRLTDVLALCPDCHEATHAGLAEVEGRLDAALAHYANVNRCTAAQAYQSFQEAAEVWRVRSRQAWGFDAGHLLQIGRGLLEPDTAERIEQMARGIGRPTAIVGGRARVSG
jgi:hypothetical protein